VAVLDLERLVSAKVAAELQQMNGRLEQLVADAVDRELHRLVHALVEANLYDRDHGEHGEHELRRRGHNVVNSTVDGLISRGWAESDGNGRVRPTELFTPDLARALTLIGERV
jgi:hypothetical protein